MWEGFIMSRQYETKFQVGDIVDDMLLIERDWSKPDVKRAVRYYCKCLKCGRVKSMLTRNLTVQHGTTHKACSQGYAKKYPKLYYTWNASLMRITNPNDRRYKDYGGRGLTHDFPLFIDFVDYMLPSYLEIKDKYDSYNITLDRIDNDKGYIRGNLRWATQKEQANNRRTNSINNVKITIIDTETKEKRVFSTLPSCAKFLNITTLELKQAILIGYISEKYDFILN